VTVNAVIAQHCRKDDQPISVRDAELKLNYNAITEILRLAAIQSRKQLKSIHYYYCYEIVHEVHNKNTQNRQ